MRVGAGCEDFLLMRLSGSDPSASRRTSVSKGSGLSRGDRNRNARLARFRGLVPLSNAITGIDLADDTQAAVVTDHDSRVIARRSGSRGGFCLGNGGVRAGRPPVAGPGSAPLAAGRGLALVSI